MDYVKVTSECLSLDDCVRRVTSPTCGAVTTFIGTTRNQFEGKPVKRLEYEAYAPMAEKEMLKICHQIRDKWPVENIAIVHRLGEVVVTEASVIVAISSEHRAESLQATEFAINTLKANVPVWKKEVYADGDSSWKENKECAWHSA